MPIRTRFASHFTRRIRMPRALAAVAALLALAGVARFGQRAALAETLLDLPNGTPRDTGTARAEALGGAAVTLFEGSAALVENPAALALADSTARVDLTLSLDHVSEDRFVPLFDTFNSFVDETAIAVNRNTYARIQGGITWRPNTDTPMAFAAGIYDRYDFNYDYSEEFRDPRPDATVKDVVLEVRDFQTRGVLRTAALGYGAQLFSPLYAGISLQRYFGHVEQSRSIADPTPATAGDPVLSEQQNLDHDLGGWGLTAGLLARVSPRVDIGVGYELNATVSGTLAVDSTTTRASGSTGAQATAADVEVQYPHALRFGVAYHPRNQLRTVFVAEAVRRLWATADDSYRTELVQIPGNAGFRNTWDVRVGLEHVFYNGVPMRAGFRYLENYADRASARSIFSAGVGFAPAGFKVDVTGELHRQTSRQPLDILFDPTATVGGETFPAPDYDARVDDSVIRLVLGVSRSF